eukprot:4081966-Prymnesium_polylepis.1
MHLTEIDQAQPAVGEQHLCAAVDTLAQRRWCERRDQGVVHAPGCPGAGRTGSAPRPTPGGRAHRTAGPAA